MSEFNNNVNALNIKHDEIQTENGIITSDQQDELNLNRMIVMAAYTAKVSTLELTVNDIDKDVSVIKSNYLTKNAFYSACLGGIILVIAAGWATYSNLDGKVTSLSDNVNQRFLQVEEKVHSLDIRLTKVEMRLDNVEKKLDNIDDKLDILIQQKQAKK